MGQGNSESMPGILRIDTDIEQDDSSCQSLSPHLLWSSNEDNIITIGADRAEACVLVQVPVEEPLDDLTAFYNETQGEEMFPNTG